MQKKFQITFWGGVGAVTGANFLVETEKTRFLVDCGLLQGVQDAYLENQRPFPYDVKSIDHLFVTHAHMDHIGRICKLVKDGFKGTIFSTPETKELANVMLEDAIRVMDTKSKEVMLGPKEKPLYGMEDLSRALSCWKVIPYHNKHRINDEIEVLLKDAGHILGSSMYEFTYDGKKLVFTGDSGNSPTPLLRDTELITDADYLVVDSVYGDRNHEDKNERDEKFKQIVLETIQAGGALIIPAFSIERTQVILYELNNLVEDKKIPSVSVFLDSPLGKKVTDIYARTSRDFNSGVQAEIKGGDNIFSFPKLSITHGFRESQNILNTPNPKIIIAGSGMSTGGRVVWHEQHFLPDPKTTLLLMGYQAVGTLGRQIQERPKEVMINGSPVPVRARIEMISGYSAHKDSDALVELVENTSKTVKKVFVVMGEPKASTFLVQRLRDELSVDAVYPEANKPYNL